jgi:HD-GYP domain-containing protein (c-di-GMP phosphodiesterase class II)
MRFRSEVVPVGDGWLALHLINSNAFSAMVIAEKLDSLSGIDVAYSVRGDGGNMDVAVMFLANKVSTRIRDMYESGIIDCCIHESASDGAFLFSFYSMCATRKEAKWSELDPDVARVLQSARATYNAIFSAQSATIPLDAAQLEQTADYIVDSLATGRITAVMNAAQHHDDSTFVHLLSVATVLAFYGQAVGIKGRDLNVMAQAGFAHDIGKRVTPHAILYKPGSLESHEMRVMKNHAADAGHILRASDGVPSEVITVAERHHERIDGGGYPNGLKLGQLDELSMVASVGDIFCALTDRRCYKPRLSEPEALNMLQIMAGDHLEPHHTRTFVHLIRDTGFSLA